jgi:hypothetical protein
MQSLEDLFNTIEDPARRCKTCRWYEALDAPNKAFFDRKADENKTKLWHACRKGGLDIAYSSFRDHFLHGHHEGPARVSG